MIIAVDFDGTLCEHRFPDIGKPIKEVIRLVKDAKDSGCKLILWTCREGEPLKEALQWCEEEGIKFDAVNENIPENQGLSYAHRKIVADYYWDDRAFGITDLRKMHDMKFKNKS